MDERPVVEGTDRVPGEPKAYGCRQEQRRGEGSGEQEDNEFSLWSFRRSSDERMGYKSVSGPEDFDPDEDLVEDLVGEEK